MKAVVLLSGGIDSATALYHARLKGYKTHCLTFDYGQRHKREVRSAKNIARASDSPWHLLKISFPWKGSALVDKSIKLPKGSLTRKNIPSTYVPARNIVFLSYALSYAEAIGADAIFVGVNQVDYSGYPDCRHSFLKAFEHSAKKGTKKGVEGRRTKICAPLMNMTKAQIIRYAVRLSVPLKHTWSCYEGAKDPCRICDSCIIRKKGFHEAGHKDHFDG
jgi:7-cyano-7-deazaguanine synthase